MKNFPDNKKVSNNKINKDGKEYKQTEEISKNPLMKLV